MALYGGQVTTVRTTYPYHYTPISAFTETIAVSGGTAPYTYQWESNEYCSYGWLNMLNKTGNTLNFGSAQFNHTYCFRRKVIDSVAAVAYSNIITLTLVETPNISGATITNLNGNSISLEWNNYYTKGSPFKEGVEIYQIYFDVYTIDSGETLISKLVYNIGSYPTITTGDTYYFLSQNTAYNLYIRTYGWSDGRGDFLTQTYKITFTTPKLKFGEYDGSFNQLGTGFGNIAGYTFEAQPHGIIVDSKDNLYCISLCTSYNGIAVHDLFHINGETGALNTAFSAGMGTGLNWGDPLYIFLSEDKPLITTNANTSFNGIIIQNNSMIRINTNGTLDTTFNFVRKIGVTVSPKFVDNGGKILAVSGGTLVRVNSNGSHDTTFTGGAVSSNFAVTQDNLGRYILGGEFITYSGVSKNYIVRLNYNGTIDNIFNIGTGFNHYVYDVAIDSQNKIYCTGRFTAYSGVTANRIIRLNVDGSIDNTFNTGTGFNLYSGYITIDIHNKIIITAYPANPYDEYNGTSAHGLIRLNSDGSIDDTFKTGDGFRITNGTVKSGMAKLYPDSKGNLFSRSGGMDALNQYSTYDYAPLNRKMIKLYSNTILPTPFCQAAPYTVSATTCGNATGKIQINNYSYFSYYDIYLTDVSGNSYTFNANGSVTGLTSNFYTLTATPKYAYWYHYGKDTCTFDWIPLEDTDTSISLLATKIKHAICGGFGKQTGRIVFQFTDSGSTTGWTYSLYTSTHVLVDQQTFTGSTFTGSTNITTLLGGGDYYAILENSNGCKYLSDMVQVKSELMYTVTGIRRLFITPWSATTSYNYYSSSDEDWYVSGIDTLQYTSTKISEYIDLADFWYEIKLHTAVMSYGETFQKDQNGLTYREEITISIPKQENSKWKQLVNILTGRYIAVFQDNHDQWWTCFYRWGADVKAYSLSENQYIITFRHPSVNKMLTAIDYDYVKLNIL